MAKQDSDRRKSPEGKYLFGIVGERWWGASSREEKAEWFEKTWKLNELLIYYFRYTQPYTF